MTSEQECNAVQMVSKVKCNLAVGHNGPHVHFEPNSTTGWGGGL